MPPKLPNITAVLLKKGPLQSLCKNVIATAKVVGSGSQLPSRGRCPCFQRKGFFWWFCHVRLPSWHTLTQQGSPFSYRAALISYFALTGFLHPSHLYCLQTARSVLLCYRRRKQVQEPQLTPLVPFHLISIYWNNTAPKSEWLEYVEFECPSLML